MEQKLHEYCIWYRAIDGLDYSKYEWAATVSKAKYKAFLELKNDCALSDETDFGDFVKHLITRIRKIS